MCIIYLIMPLLVKHAYATFFLKQWQELCLSIKTNEVYIQAKITKRGAKHREMLAHPRNALEYTPP